MSVRLESAAWLRRDRWRAIPDHRDDSGTGRNGCGKLGDRRAIWIAWEKQRRTTELARGLGVPLFRFTSRAPALGRYLVLAQATYRVLRAERPDILIIQNPSLILALFSVLWRRIFGYTLVVDRHTNFMINREPSLTRTVFTRISDFTLRRSDLTIVTNDPLADLVSTKGGRAFVLPDRIPDIPPDRTFPLAGAQNVCFICSFANDEPYEEVVRIADALPRDLCLYITGNPAKATWSDRTQETIRHCDNLKFTGFLSDRDYHGLLNEVDVIVDLTTFDHCLVCGAYEAAAVGKPLVLSEKRVNHDLFGDYPVYVRPDRDSILDGIKQALSEAADRRGRAAAFKRRYVDEWERRFANLQQTVTDLAGCSESGHHG